MLQQRKQAADTFYWGPVALMVEKESAQFSDSPFILTVFPQDVRQCLLLEEEYRLIREVGCVAGQQQTFAQQRIAEKAAHIQMV